MKGGSIASDYVNTLLPTKCKNILKPYKFAIGNSSLRNAKLYQIGSGKKSGKRRVRKTKKARNKKGGSPMSKIVMKTARMRSISSKKNPGIFPKQENCKIKVLDIPKLVGGKRRKKYNKRGGSDWVSTVRSYSYNPQSKKHLNRFTKSMPYIQNKNKISSGRMFFPLSLKKSVKDALKKNKIGPFKITRKVRNMIKNISKYPMFRLLQL